MWRVVIVPVNGVPTYGRISHASRQLAEEDAYSLRQALIRVGIFSETMSVMVDRV